VISRAVVANRAHLGVAFDGDADRLILCDENGTVVDGDAVMAICALHLMKHGKLRHNTLVATVMSNLGLELALREAGGKLVRASVGDRYVMEKMIEGGYNLGGDRVYYFPTIITGDGSSRRFRSCDHEARQASSPLAAA
jgi:phosphoglucosamine mutase